jgi:hypothetical protein
VENRCGGFNHKDTSNNTGFRRCLSSPMSVFAERALAAQVPE